MWAALGNHAIRTSLRLMSSTILTQVQSNSGESHMMLTSQKPKCAQRDCHHGKSLAAFDERQSCRGSRWRALEACSNSTLIETKLPRGPGPYSNHDESTRRR